MLVARHTCNHKGSQRLADTHDWILRWILGRERARAAVHQRRLLLTDVIIDGLTPYQRQHFDTILERLLRSLVKTAKDADHICRLCDGEECPPSTVLRRRLLRSMPRDPQ
jgi:hypothetical protein